MLTATQTQPARKPRKIDPATIKTNWSGGVAVQRSPDTRLGGGTFFGGDTLEQAQAIAAKEATHFAGLGYRVYVEDFRQCCATCNGKGIVPHARKWLTTTTCKACHGHGTFAVVAGFLFCDFPVVSAE